MLSSGEKRTAKRREARGETLAGDGTEAEEGAEAAAAAALLQQHVYHTQQHMDPVRKRQAQDGLVSAPI